MNSLIDLAPRRSQSLQYVRTTRRASPVHIPPPPLAQMACPLPIAACHCPCTLFLSTNILLTIIIIHDSLIQPWPEGAGGPSTAVATGCHE